MVKPRGVLFVVMLALILMAGCDNNSKVEPPPATPMGVIITVADLHPELASVPGATVTCLAGCEKQQVSTTDSLGKATIIGVEPFLVRVEKEGYFQAEKQVSEGGTITLEREPVAVTISVVDSDNISLPEATVACITGCQNQQVGTTDTLGQTTLTGVEPLNVRVEKDRYISVEQQVFNGDTITLEREPVAVTISVVDSDNISLPEAAVTCITGCQNQQVSTTDSLGQATITGVEPFLVRVEKEGYFPAEKQVFEGGTITLEREPVAVTISVVDSDNISLPEAAVTCITGCQNQQVSTTDSLGQATLTGVEPLNVRVEKDRYISIEQTVSNGDTITLEREPVAVTISVVDLHPELASVPGATATCLVGCDGQQIKTTNSEGRVTLTGKETLTVRAEKPGYDLAEKQVSDGDTIVLQKTLADITFTVELPYPDYPEGHSHDIRVGISEATITCLVGCEGQQTKAANEKGEVTFIGQTPLTVQAEKTGYISVEKQIYDGDRVNMGHEWPPELEAAILQLDLGSVILNSELFLVWEDEEYIEASIRESGDPYIGGQFVCPVIFIKRLENKDFMLWILVHEAMHAWQGLKSMNPPCNIHGGYPQSKEGRAWAEARDKDIKEHGPYIGLDNKDWTSNLWENQAGFYSLWYLGPETRELGSRWNQSEELERLYRLAPNRSKYMEDRFGPPPPRR